MREDLQIKPITEITRFLLNSTFILALFLNSELMLDICGPFTHPIHNKQSLILYIMAIELFRICFKMIAVVLDKLPVFKSLPSYFSELLIIKYILILVLKVFLIFQEQHRKKFYLHSLLQEGTILAAAILFDCLQKQNIKEAGELLLIEGLHKISLVYDLTQKFCPNLILYYAVHNLLVFIMSQVQAQQKYGLKHSLYVKHDVYRFMFITCLFFGLTSLAQLTTSNFKMLITFLLCLKFFMNALKGYNESNFSSTLRNLAISGVIMGLCQLAFLWLPFSFENTGGNDIIE